MPHARGTVCVAVVEAWGDLKNNSVPGQSKEAILLMKVRKPGEHNPGLQMPDQQPGIVVRQVQLQRLKDLGHQKKQQASAPRILLGPCSEQFMCAFSALSDQTLSYSTHYPSDVRCLAISVLMRTFLPSPTKARQRGLSIQSWKGLDPGQRQTLHTSCPSQLLLVLQCAEGTPLP